MARMFFHWTEPSSKATLPPRAPTCGDLVSFETQRKGMLPSRAAPPWQCGAITQPRPPDRFRPRIQITGQRQERAVGEFLRRNPLRIGLARPGFLVPAVVA